MLVTVHIYSAIHKYGHYSLRYMVLVIVHVYGIIHRYSTVNVYDTVHRYDEDGHFAWEIVYCK